MPVSEAKRGSEVIGRIFSIQRCSLHDGPGMRSVVYLKGCNLRCKWCHNPEGMDARPQILFHPSRCIACGGCASICPECHSFAGGMHIFDRHACARCGRCANICPANALEFSGRAYSPDALVAILMKDADYYRHSGGGVSFSGGECLLQIDFFREVAEKLRRNGVHVLVESALCIPQDHVLQAAKLADAFFVDLKHMDSAAHKRGTGCGNETILENVRLLCSVHGDVTLRVPLIPNFNTAWENLLASARFALDVGARGVQLLRYNALAASKYRSAGMSYQSFGSETQSPEDMRLLCTRLNSQLSKTNFVFWKE